MSFHSGQSFTFGETPSATKWNYLWENDYALADGTGISDNAIDSRHYVDGSIDPEHPLYYDYQRTLWGTAGKVIAGTWVRNGANTGTTFGGVDNMQSGGTINEELQFQALLKAGTYSVYLHCDKDINRGIYSIYIDGVLLGTYDAYAATRVANVIGAISTSLSIATNKLVDIRIKMESKNGSSPNYYATVYSVDFVKTA